MSRLKVSTQEKEPGMQLAFSETSPYVRKVRICAIERGLADNIELVPTTVLPTEKNPEYTRDGNPLGKIPALRLDCGQVIYNSGVICEYLDSLPGGDQLIPADASRWAVLTQHHLASGILDALVALRYETWLRPENLRWSDWAEGQQRKAFQAMDWFEAHPEMRHGPLNLAQISLGCALGYWNFRFADLDWRQYSGLKAWYAEFSQRPSMQATQPPA
ncbi:MAG: glutathione S-transferase [Xanthomonadales bacterium]|nr:glutathione S-transferase [Xanthomonadales bacterium]